MHVSGMGGDSVNLALCQYILCARSTSIAEQGHSAIPPGVKNIHDINLLKHGGIFTHSI